MTHVEELRSERAVELVPTPLLPDGYGVPASRWTNPSHADARAARDRALPLRPRRVRPDGRPARDVPRVQGRLLQRLLVRHRPPRHDRHGPLHRSRSPTALGARSRRCGSSSSRWPSATRRRASRRATSRSRRSSSTWTAATGTSSTCSARPSCTSTPAWPLRTSKIRCFRSAAATSAARRSSPASEMVGKLRMARAVADDCGNDDFVIIARTDGLSAIDAPESTRGLDLAIERAPALPRHGHPRPASGASSRPRSASRSRRFADRDLAGASRMPGSRSTGRARSSGSTTPTRSPSPSSASWGSSSSSSPSAASTRWASACRSSCSGMGEMQEQGYIDLQRQEWADGRGRSRPAATTSSPASRTTISWARSSTPHAWARSSWRSFRPIRSCSRRPHGGPRAPRAPRARRRAPLRAACDSPERSASRSRRRGAGAGSQPRQREGDARPPAR